MCKSCYGFGLADAAVSDERTREIVQQEITKQKQRDEIQALVDKAFQDDPDFQAKARKAIEQPKEGHKTAASSLAEALGKLNKKFRGQPSQGRTGLIEGRTR